MAVNRMFTSTGGGCRCAYPRLVFEKQHQFLFKLRGEIKQGGRGVKLRCLECGGFKWWHPSDPRLADIVELEAIFLLNESIDELTEDGDPFSALVAKELEQIKDKLGLSV